MVPRDRSPDRAETIHDCGAGCTRRHWLCLALKRHSRRQAARWRQRSDECGLERLEEINAERYSRDSHLRRSVSPFGIAPEATEDYIQANPLRRRDALTMSLILKNYQ